MKVLLKHFLIENEHQKYKFMQFMCMSDFHKNHKPEVENELTMVPLSFCFPNSLLLLFFANLLWIHYLYLKFPILQQSISRIHSESTLYCESSKNPLNHSWNHFKHFLLREITLNPLSLFYANHSHLNHKRHHT